jgi:hypothetical protein
VKARKSAAGIHSSQSGRCEQTVDGVVVVLYHETTTMEFRPLMAGSSGDSKNRESNNA